MNLKKLPELAQGVLGIAPISTVAATVDGPTIDRLAAPQQGFEAAKLTGTVGAASGTPTTQSVVYQLRDSPDDITYADFGAAIPAMTTDDAADSVNLDLAGADRYLQVRAVVSFTGGTAPEQVIGAVLTMLGPSEAPTAD